MLFRSSGEIGTHDSHDALGRGENGFLQDVVAGGQHVINRVEGQGNVRECVKTRAVLVYNDTFEERREKSVRSHDERGSGVNSGLITGGINDAVGAG